MKILFKYFIILYFNIVKFYSLIKNIKFANIFNAIDYFILIIVIFALLGDFIFILSSIISHLLDFCNINFHDSLIYMSEQAKITQTTTNNTTTTIIHDDGSWSNGIRSLFIYGAGALRLQAIRNGSPLAKTFVVGGTVLTEVGSRIMINMINDPNYVKNHHTSWKSMWRSSDIVDVEIDDATTSKITEPVASNSASSVNNASKYIPDDINLSEIYNTYFKDIFEIFKHVLEPVQVSYSNELLANQINDIAIILFILVILIMFLLVILFINILLYINMDIIIKYFNNKYIIWYLTFNKKMMGIEIFISSVTILYFMFIVSKGILFIATHPVIIN